MQFWIIQGLNSLSLGGLLFLLSSGFSLIFGLMRLANLTHGAFFMLGTYFAAVAMRTYTGLNIWATALGAGLVVAAIGGLFERLVLTRLRTNPLGQVLVTLGRWRARWVSRFRLFSRLCFASARASQAPAACSADRSSPPIPGLTPTCCRWR